MNFYRVKLKEYNGVKELNIVAATPTKALEATRKWQRQNFQASKEILSVEKMYDIHGHCIK